MMYDYETIELRGPNGEVARPISIGFKHDGTDVKQYYINPNAYGEDFNALQNQNIKGGWSKDYEEAYKTHKINTRQLDGTQALPKGTKLITTSEELTEMYDEVMGVTNLKKKHTKPTQKHLSGRSSGAGKKIKNLNQMDEIVGYNNIVFDDNILNKQISEFGSEKAKAKLKRIKRNDVRHEAFEVLMNEGTNPTKFKEEMMRTTGLSSRNSDMAELFGIASDSTKLHDAEYDVRVTNAVREKINSLKGHQEALMNARSTEEFNELWGLMEGELGPKVTQTPKMQSILKQASAKGINVEQHTKKVNERIAQIGETAQQGYNGKGGFKETINTAGAALKKLSSQLDSKGFTYKMQKRTGIAAGVAAGAYFGSKLMFGSNQEEQNKKLEVLNERINASSGEYLEY